MKDTHADLLEKYDWHPTTEKFEVYYDAHLRTLQDRPAALSERVGRINNTGSEFAKALYGEQHTLVSALTQMMMSFWNTGYLEHATEFSEANYNNYWWFVKEGQGTIKDLSSTYKLL